MDGCVIGYDLGSQGAKATLCSSDGRILGSAYQDYPIIYPRPAWAEQEPSHWIAALKSITLRVLEQTSGQAKRVLGLGLDAYVDSILPVDEQLQPLRNAFLWMDRRAVSQCEQLAKSISPARLFELTGLNLDPSHSAAKILLIRDNEPELFERAYKFLVPASYMVGYLTGELAVDYSNASSTMLLDITTREWSDEILAAMQLTKEKLAPVKPATAVAGFLRPKVAIELGLPEGIPVVVGCGDEHASCVGAGVIGPGPVCDIGGTAEPVAAATSQPLYDPTRLVETHCHADPDSWLMENPGFVSGANLRWYRDHFAPAEMETARVTGIDAYELLTLQARDIPPGADGLIFLPCLMGAMTPEWNAHARGVIYGLTLHHRRAHIARSFLEASAYGLRDIVERMIACGLECQEIRAVGGQASSSLWRQIKADVTGIPVTSLAVNETASLGAALLAAVAVGLFPGLKDAADVFVQKVDTKYPDARAHAMYNKSYDLYREVYQRLQPTFRPEWSSGNVVSDT